MKIEKYEAPVDPTPSPYKGHVTKPPVDTIGGCDPQHPRVPDLANRIHLYAGEQIAAEWQSDVTTRFRLTLLQKILVVMTFGLYYVYLYLVNFIFKCCLPQSGDRVFQRLILTSQGRMISLRQSHSHNKSARTLCSGGSESGSGNYEMQTYAVDKLTMIQRMVDRPNCLERLLCCRGGDRQMTVRFVFDSFPDELDDGLIRSGVGGKENPIKVQQLGANRVEDLIMRASPTDDPMGAPVGSLSSGGGINFDDPAAAIIGIGKAAASGIAKVGMRFADLAFRSYYHVASAAASKVAGDSIAFTNATQMIKMTVSVTKQNTDWANKSSSDGVATMENFVAAVTGMRGATSTAEFASPNTKNVDVDMDLVKPIQGEAVLDKVGVPAAGTAIDVIMVVLTFTLWYWLLLKPRMVKSGTLVMTDRRLVYYAGKTSGDYCSVSYYVNNVKIVRKIGKYGARLLTEYGFLTIEVPEEFGPRCMPCGGALTSPEPMIYKLMQPIKSRRLIDYDQLCQSFPSMRSNNPAGDLKSDFFPKGFLLPDETLVAVAETDDYYNLCPNTGTWLSVKCRERCCCHPEDEPKLILTSHRLILHSHLTNKWNDCFPLGNILRVLGWCIPYFRYKYRNWLVCDLSRVRGVGFEGKSNISNKTCPVVLACLQPVMYTCICCPTVNSNLTLNVALEGFSRKGLAVNKQHMDNTGIVEDSQMASMINVLSFVTNLNKFVQV